VFSGHDFTWSILIPFVVAILVLIAGILVRRGACAFPLAMGCAFLAGFPAIQSGGAWRVPTFPPADSTAWLIWIGLLATVLGIVHASISARTIWSAAAVAVAIAVGLGFMLHFKFVAAWTPLEGAGVISIFALAGAIGFAALEISAGAAPIATSLLFWMIGSCLAVSSMLVGIQSYGKSGLMLAAAGAAMVAAMLLDRRHPSKLCGASTVFAILCTCLLAGEIFLGSFSPWIAAAIAAAPIVAAIALRLARWKPPLRGAIMLLLAALPLVAAVTLSLVQFRHDQQAQSADDYNDYP
jgi:hypothetical protein